MSKSEKGMETDSLPTAEMKPPKLRWYQWRLRSLFVLTLLAAIGMSWLTVIRQDQRKQKAAAEALTKAGEKSTSEPTWLGKLLRDDSLVERDLRNPFRGVSHRTAGLAPFQGLSQLEVPVFDTPKIAPQSHRCRVGPSPRVESAPTTVGSTERKSPMPGW